MKIFLIFLALSVSISAFSKETLIKDPNHILEKVDQFLPTQKFEDAFVCSTKAQFFSPVKSVELGCGEDGCSALFQSDPAAESEWEVSNCKSESVSIYANDGVLWDISTVLFQKYKNAAKIFLTNLESYIGYEGEVKITSFENATYKLTSGKTFASLNVHFQFYLKGEPRPFTGLISVIKDSPSVAQVARFRLENTTWFRLKEF